jgi:hypothetical protein
MESLTKTLLERVEELIPARETPPEWGSALSSSTPRSVALHDLAVRTAALEGAVREIAAALQQIAQEAEGRPQQR